MQIKRTIKRTIGMCVSPAIEVVTIKARHMDAKRTIVLLRLALNTALCMDVEYHRNQALYHSVRKSKELQMQLSDEA